VGFLIGDGPVFDASRHNEKLALFEPNVPIPKLHAKPTFHDEEKLVLAIMVMPHEGPLKLDKLDLLAVELANDFGTPVVVEKGEFVNEIDLFHLVVPSCDRENIHCHSTKPVKSHKLLLAMMLRFRIVIGAGSAGGFELLVICPT
jgi:hypothetical protein